MSLCRLIIRNLVWYRRQHLALFAGTLIAVAVLTGALIVGDSVKHSLQKLAGTRLGGIRYNLSTGGRFVRAGLAGDLNEELNANSSAVLIINGIAVNQENGERVNPVQVLGIDSSFWNFAITPLPSPGPGEAVLSMNVAERLGLKKGDAILLRAEQTSLLPANAPFSPEKKPSVALRLIISDIAGDNNLGRFSLKNNQVSPFTIFVNRDMLAGKLGLEGLANTVLVGENNENSLSPEKINEAFGRVWKPIDAGIIVKDLPGEKKYEIVSNRVFIDKPVSDALGKTVPENEKILTYLVNTIENGSRSTPYSFVSALSMPSLQGGNSSPKIAINNWLADDLGAKPGDTLHLSYFVIGPLRKLAEKSTDFVVSEIIPLNSSLTDATLMPDFPGLSDAGSCRDWNTGVPIDLKRIRDKDEQYWNDYRGTPKALIALPEGVRLWGNLFGECTSIRIDKGSFSPDSVMRYLMREIKPAYLGMSAFPVYSEGLASAGNGVDFGELFLGLSFFIISAAILLIVLIFSLNLSSREKETAIFSGLGLPRKMISKIRLAEAFAIVLPASIAGAFVGILYNTLLIKALNTVWQGAVQTGMLEASIKWQSLVLGPGIGLMLSLTTIIIVTRMNLGIQVHSLLRGNLFNGKAGIKTPGKKNKYFAIILIAIAILIVFYSVLSGAYENPVLFLSSGSLILAGAIFAFVWLLGRLQKEDRYSRLSIFRLALKNAARSKGRSLAVVMLLAIGVFSIVLTGAYRKTYSGSENENTSGTGGYTFWLELAAPVSADLNDPETQNKYLLTEAGNPQHIHFEQFTGLEGDDASCLNLNQVNRPRILGVDPQSFDQRGSFSFLSLLSDTMKNNPWLELRKPLGKNIIQGFADLSVIQYGLKKSLGDTLVYLNESGEKLRIVLTAGLDNSVFQGNLIVDKDLLVSQFPSAAECRTMLVSVSGQEEKRAADVLNRSFADFGIALSPTSLRLAEFNKVENTYLSVFMILGGLGLIIGSFGLAIVLYRNVLERRHEFAMFSALGINRKQISRIIFYENIFLFTSGMVTGLLSAFIAILPSFLLPGFQTQTAPMAFILGALILIGLLWTWVPVRMGLKGKLIDSLRNE